MNTELSFPSLVPVAGFDVDARPDLQWGLHLASLDWASVRRAPDVSDYELSEQARQWLAALPAQASPRALPSRHPHIANRMAALQDQPADLLAYFGELLHDRRGDRQGFSSEVAQDLERLHRYALRSRPARPVLLRPALQAQAA